MVATNIKDTKLILNEGTPIASLQNVTNCRISKPIKDRNYRGPQRKLQPQIPPSEDENSTSEETTPPAEKKKRNKRRRTKVLRIRPPNIPA